jgi:hypothetical protein
MWPSQHSAVHQVTGTFRTIYRPEPSSPEPISRHWIYDERGDLVAKSGMIDFKGWTQENFGDNTPWGDNDSPAIVTQVETELERQLSTKIMREGKKPAIRKLGESEALVNQGDPGAEVTGPQHCERGLRSRWRWLTRRTFSRSL